MGVFLVICKFTGFCLHDIVSTYCWLHVRMNWAPLAASVGFSTDSWLAMIPTGKPDEIRIV